MHSSTVRLSSFVNGSPSWFVWLLKGSLGLWQGVHPLSFVYIIMMVLSRLIREAQWCGFLLWFGCGI